MGTFPAIVLAVVLLLANSYFVATEFALVSARRSRMEPRASEGSRMARTALGAMERLTQVIAATQFGVTLCSLGLGAVAEPSVVHLLEPVTRAVHLPQGSVHPVAFAVALVLVAYLHVVIGEMVPKNLSLAGPERAAMVLAPPMMAMITVLRPVAVALDATANAIVRLLRMEPRSELNSAFTVEEVGAMVDESRSVGLLEQGEYERLSGALVFSAKTVADVLLPSDELDLIHQGARATDVEDACARTGFSRFPVAAADGSLIGYLHVKDVLGHDPHGRARVVEDRWIRPFASVRQDAPLDEVLRALQALGAHMAVVRNEADEVVGVATLEDVLEELVGQITDASHAEPVQE